MISAFYVCRFAYFVYFFLLVRAMIITGVHGMCVETRFKNYN